MPFENIQYMNSKKLILGDMIARNARKFPRKTALVFQDNRFTYSELNTRVNSIAGNLLERGIGTGSNVGLLLYNSHQMVEMFFACNKIGAVAIPINFRLSPGEIAYILTQVEASALVYEAELESNIEFADQMDFLTLPVRVRGEKGAPGRAIDYEQLAGDHFAEPDIVVGEDDAAFIMHTSGTTGRPKGAVLTHKNLYINTLNWIIEVGADSESVWVSGLQLFHIGGLDGILPFFLLGGKNVILDSTGFNPESALRILEGERATHCYFVPTQWQAITRSNTLKNKNLDSLSKAMWGASNADSSLLTTMHELFPNIEIINAFGQTEMSSNTTFLKGRDAVRKIGSVGKPVFNLEVRVVDDQDRDVESGHVGEILYRGPTVFNGYYKDPEATAEALRGGWFHSGDLVIEDEAGYFYVVDRKKDMIISGGENIYPAEIERVLNEHPMIAESAVIGVSDDKWVETPLAWVVLEEKKGLTEEDVISYCKSKLASYKKPTKVLFRESLPRNQAGKIQKSILKDFVKTLMGG